MTHIYIYIYREVVGKSIYETDLLWTSRRTIELYIPEDAERNGAQFSLIYMHNLAKANITEVIVSCLSFLIFWRMQVKPPFGIYFIGPWYEKVTMFYNSERKFEIFLTNMGAFEPKNILGYFWYLVDKFYLLKIRNGIRFSNKLEIWTPYMIVHIPSSKYKTNILLTSI